MLRPRIIPCLLVKGGGLVKTLQFSQPKYVGDPMNAVRIFNEKEVDEIVVTDTIVPWQLVDASVLARLRQVSTVPLVAEAIRRLHEGGSLVELGAA